MKIQNLSFSYNQRQIFDQLNISFSDEKVNVVIGPNGVGKSTLLDIIAGLYPQCTKQSLVDIPDHSAIAYQLQQNHFYPTLTVDQTIRMYQSIDHAGGTAPTRTMEEIETQVLDSIGPLKIGQLSGGERQIVLNYGTCLLNRELYIFDEPISGVDPRNSELILRMITSLVTEQHKKVIITLHQMDQIENLPAHLVALNNRQCVFTGSYQELMQQEQTENLNMAFNSLVNK
ncbi:MAG: ATP-binding cassette domain-containing protein [Rummeliibacillus sp.]